VHEDLAPRGGRNTLDGQDPGAWNVDTEGHGTHCAGVVAALRKGWGSKGSAPLRRWYWVNVFQGARSSSLLQAPNWPRTHRLDVFTRGLGGADHAHNLELAIKEGVKREIVFVAAAGNEAGALAYPAALDNVIAVSAIDKTGPSPANSAHALRVGSYMSAQG